MNKTIYSLVTLPVNQNIAVIRISGPEAFDVIKKISPKFKPEKNKIKYSKIYGKEGLIDEAIILSFFSPNSFTGENIIEIQFHGNMFIVKKIISEINSFGIKQADPGEFMRQAYINGKIDLSKSEAIDTLIKTDSIELSNLAVENISGKQTNFIKNMLNDLGDIVSKIQVSIDYPENNDLPEYNILNIKNKINKYKLKLEKIIFDSQKLVSVSKGIKMVLIGKPNSGKSTLMNNLVNEDKAIVSNIEGTTRDVIESVIYINGLKFTIQDTAGIRDNSYDEIEKNGIDRTFKAIEKSDIILLLIDGTKSILNQKKYFKDVYKNYSNKLIEVITKSDLVKNKGINISKNPKSLEVLLNEINKFIEKNIFNKNENNNSLLINQSQINNFNNILQSINNALNFIKLNETSDVICFELENSMKILGKILGKVVDQNYISNLFSNFCLGK